VQVRCWIQLQSCARPRANGTCRRRRRPGRPPSSGDSDDLDQPAAPQGPRATPSARACRRRSHSRQRLGAQRRSHACSPGRNPRCSRHDRRRCWRCSDRRRRRGDSPHSLSPPTSRPAAMLLGRCQMRMARRFRGKRRGEGLSTPANALERLLYAGIWAATRRQRVFMWRDGCTHRGEWRTVLVCKRLTWFARCIARYFFPSTCTLTLYPFSW
jgi:hypothetical protein